MSNTPMTVNVSSDALAKNHKWITERNDLIKKAFIVSKVETDEQAEASGSVQTAIAKHIKALEAERKAVTAPLDAMKKEIMAQEKELAKNLQSELTRLKTMNDAYATAKWKEAERKRIEAEQESQRKAMEAVAEQEEARAMFGDDVQFEEVDLAPVPEQAEKLSLSGNRTVKRWEFRMVDSSMVPTDYLVLNEKAVRAYIKMQESLGKEPELPGIKFEARISVESK